MHNMFLLMVIILVTYIPLSAESVYAPCKVGDPNNNGIIGIADIVFIIQYIFSGGPPPIPEYAAGDCNCDGLVNITDVIYLLNYKFTGGPAPGDPNNDLIPDCTCAP